MVHESFQFYVSYETVINGRNFKENDVHRIINYSYVTDPKGSFRTLFKALRNITKIFSPSPAK